MAMFVERVTMWILERRKLRDERDQEIRALSRMNRIR